MRNYIHTQKNSIIQVRYTYSFVFFFIMRVAKKISGVKNGKKLKEKEIFNERETFV